MENTYRLEFNEKKQAFHLESHSKRYQQKEGTHGWETILLYCTDDEFKELEIYIAIHRREKTTISLIHKCIQDLKRFKELTMCMEQRKELSKLLTQH